MIKIVIWFIFYYCIKSHLDIQFSQVGFELIFLIFRPHRSQVYDSLIEKFFYITLSFLRMRSKRAIKSVIDRRGNGFVFIVLFFFIFKGLAVDIENSRLLAVWCQSVVFKFTSHIYNVLFYYSLSLLYLSVCFQGLLGTYEKSCLSLEFILLHFLLMSFVLFLFESSWY